jgi:hypothetical protein
MERYLRFRVFGVGSKPNGQYGRLRQFVQWCERTGIDAVGRLRGADICEYSGQRRREIDAGTHERELVAIEQFCRFLEDVGASGVADLAATVPGPQHRPSPEICDAPASPKGTAADDTGGNASPGRKRHRETVPVSHDIEPGERVSTAIVRAVGAVDGRCPKFMPPLRNVLDPRALDGIFEDKPDGSPRTGGRLSFVYASCRVVLENDEYVTIEPLSTVSQR